MTLNQNELERHSEQLQKEHTTSAHASDLTERLLCTMEEQLKLTRSEREEMARQHAIDKEFLTSIFRELEVPSALNPFQATKEPTIRK